MSRDQQPCSTSVVLVVDRLSGRIDKDQLGCVSRNNNVMSDGLAKSGLVYDEIKWRNLCLCRLRNLHNQGAYATEI
ncbi:hypothetical protein V6N13_016776 [Hibiscus sabdariffa]